MYQLFTSLENLTNNFFRLVVEQKNEFEPINLFSKTASKVMRQC